MSSPARGSSLDVAGLPSYRFSHQSPMWWGTLGMIAIEATVFALAIATYLFLRVHSSTWPMSALPPDLLWGTLNTAIMDRDYSHPCIIVWVPFNESWGVPELPSVQAHRHAVEALYHLTKTLDQTRAVIGNDGWESSATDIIGIHDYDSNLEHIRQRYGPEVEREKLFDRRRPGGRVLTLDGYPHQGQPIMCVMPSDASRSRSSRRRANPLYSS